MSADLINGVADDPQSLNKFGYALNSPTNFVDPLGLKTCTRTKNGQFEEFECPPAPPLDLDFSMFFGHINYFTQAMWDDTHPRLKSKPSGNESNDKNQQPPCLDPTSFGADQSGLLDSLYKASRALSYFSPNESVGVGVSGGFSLGIQVAEKFGLGASGSGSLIFVTDKTGQSALIVGVSSPFGGMSVKPSDGGIGRAANVGLQVMFSSQSIKQMTTGWSPYFSGSVGGLALDLTPTSRAYTVGVGAGARAGGGGGGSASSVLFYICR